MTSKIELTYPSGKSRQFVNYRGLTYRNRILTFLQKDFAEHIENVVNLDIRDDDVYLATYPKSGTHWMWEILVMLRKGTAEYEENVKEFAMLDFRSVEHIDLLPSPRVLNCHYPTRLVPKQVFEKGTKVVVVHRNFKDVLVSLYHHTQQLQPEDDKDTLSEFIQLNLGKFGFAPNQHWVRYVKDWDEMSKKYPGQILTVYFEDLKEDPVREITKIDKFLETGRDEQLISDIARACDFNNLKKADENKKRIQFSKAPATDGDTKPKPVVHMYRKGQVGDWKNHLTVRDNEEIDQWLSENMVDTSFNFRYTL